MTAQLPNERSDSPGLLPPGGTLKPTARRLLEAAVVAFAERGYHGVSIRDLTTELGMTVGSVYTHFASKEALLYDLIRFGHEAHQAAVRDAVLGAQSDPTSQLRDGVHANVAFQATYPMITVVANNEMHALSPEHQITIAGIRHDSAALLSAVIERGHSIGTFDCPDTMLAMAAIGSMGIRVASWFRPPWLAEIEASNRYPGEVASWLGASDYTVEAIAEAYAEYALRIVKAS